MAQTNEANGLQISTASPTLAFDFKAGTALLYLDGKPQDFWYPRMFTNTNLECSSIAEADSPRDMSTVVVTESIKLLDENILQDKFLHEHGPMEFKWNLEEKYKEADAIHAGAYVKIMDDRIDSWRLFIAGLSKERKTTVPQCWGEIGIHASNNTQVKFNVDPKKHIFQR